MPSACWPYGGARDKRGYGRAWVDGRAVYTHRAAYEVLVGTIPAGLEMDHLCRNPPCYNPAHLEPVTHRENVHRGEAGGTAQRARTHCPQGHPYDETNTLLYRNHRYCRPCHAGRERQRRLSRKATQ